MDSHGVGRLKSRNAPWVARRLLTPIQSHVFSVFAFCKKEARCVLPRWLDGFPFLYYLSVYDLFNRQFDRQFDIETLLCHDAYSFGASANDALIIPCAD